MTQHKVSKPKSSEENNQGARGRNSGGEKRLVISKYTENDKSQVFHCQRRELHIKGVTYKGKKTRVNSTMVWNWKHCC